MPRLPTLLLLLAAALLAGCIDSRCYRDKDCPSGRICLKSSGACVTPQCQSDGDCGEGRICQAGFCADGCRDDDQCGESQLCVQGRCVLRTARAEGCECIPAPGFCLEDVHPASPTMGEQVCLEDGRGDALLLFYGNVG